MDDDLLMKHPDIHQHKNLLSFFPEFQPFKTYICFEGILMTRSSFRKEKAPERRVKKQNVHILLLAPSTHEKHFVLVPLIENVRLSLLQSWLPIGAPFTSSCRTPI